MIKNATGRNEREKGHLNSILVYNEHNIMNAVADSLLNMLLFSNGDTSFSSSAEIAIACSANTPSKANSLF